MNKSQLTREINQLTSHLEELKTLYRKGSNLYLGDPIRPQIRETKKELERLLKMRQDA